MSKVLVNILVFLLLSASGNAQFKKHDNIRFDFRIDSVSDLPGLIRIHATLYNPNKDTVYFIGTSCNGAEYSIHYDTTVFQLQTKIMCNLSVPVSLTIPPKGQFNFATYIKVLKPSKEIKLGFLFDELERFYDKDELPLKDDSLGKYIWAPAKSL